MLDCFISYQRQSEVQTRQIAEDLTQLGHKVWFDEELTGGQAWWERILERIQGCDVFLFVLTRTALDSVACQREYTYAAALGKRILPIRSDETPVELWPDELTRLQFVDYRQRSADGAAAFSLSRALLGLPMAQPLPTPLPKPPQEPISRLGDLCPLILCNPPLPGAMTGPVGVRHGLRGPKPRPVPV